MIIDGYNTWERETRSGYLAGDEFGPEKIIMGTDWPGSDFDLERMKIAHAIPDPEHRQRAEGGNLAVLLSLEPGRMTSADRRDLA